MHQEEVTLLKLPPTAQKEILDQLCLNDILSLRLTCIRIFEWTKTSTDLKSRVSDRTVRLKNIQQVQDFGNTVRTLPFSRFEIQLDQNSFNNGSAVQLQQSVNKFASSIYHMKVPNMYCCMTDEEFQFYNSMTSLKTLEVETIRFPDDSNPSGANGSINVLPRVPHTFISTLESFKCTDCVSSFYPYDILEGCPRLKFISTPTFGRNGSPFIVHPSLPPLTHDLYNKEISRLTEALTKRNRIVDHEVGIEMIIKKDNDWMRKNHLDKMVGLNFLKAVGLRGVELLNVNITLAEIIHNNRQEWDKPTLKNILQSIVNLKGICPSMQMYEMGSLRNLELTKNENRMLFGCHDCIVDDWKTYRKHFCPVWPNLLSISARIVVWKNGGKEAEDTLAMLNFLLQPFKPRTSVKELSFNFIKWVPNVTPEYFTVKFSNLQKLNLNNNKFKQADYSQLFLLLGIQTKIRILELTSSVLLDDETFSGPTGQQSVPLFSTLKYLRSFHLIHRVLNFSKICGITDQTLVRIFASMPLERLLIHGTDLPEVSEGGLEALASGKLGEVVCDFNIQLPHSTVPDNSRFARAFKTLGDLAKINRSKQL